MTHPENLEEHGAEPMQDSLPSEISFHQDIYMIQYGEEIPVVCLEFRVWVKDRHIDTPYLRVLTSELQFGLGDQLEYSLTHETRELIQETTKCIQHSVKKGLIERSPVEIFLKEHEDFHPLELKEEWREFCIRLGHENKTKKAAGYLTRGYGLTFPNLETMVQLQWELLEEGTDVMLFRDVFTPCAELSKALQDHSGLEKLQSIITQFPKALKKLDIQSVSLSLKLITMAIRYLEDCYKEGYEHLGPQHLDALFELMTERHELNARHFDDLAYPILHDPFSEACPENLELVISRRHQRR